MQTKDFRDRLAIFIIVSNIGLFLLIIILHGMKGFTDEELTDLFKCLGPVKSLYISAALRYILKKNSKEYTNFDIQPQFRKVIRLLIYIDLIIVYGLIIKYALGGPSFNSLVNWIALVETGFGATIGAIITGMFPKQESA